MTGADDLVAFIAARLDDDEQTARKAFSPLPGQEAGAVWSADYSAGMQVRDGIGHLVVTHSWVQLIEHMTRFDPKRALADVEAKRRILDLHPVIWRVIGWLEDGDDEYAEIAVCGTCVPKHSHFSARSDVPDKGCPTQHLLALPYAEHPDYRQEWAP